MFKPLVRLDRAMTIGIIAMTMTIVISSFSIVRAQRYPLMPNGIATCTTGKSCVEGNSKSTPLGVLGISPGNNGVQGQSSATARAGVAGLESGNGNGLYGESNDTSGQYAALFGRADASATNIFYGYNKSTNGYCLVDPTANLTCNGAIEAGPTNAVGVFGKSTQAYGVEGTSTYSDGIHGASLGGSGVSGTTSSGGYGVFGTSSGSYGTGVYGLGSTGVLAIAADPLGFAFYAAGSGSNSGFCNIDPYGNLFCTGSVMGALRALHRTGSGRHVLAYASQSTTATIEDFGTAQMTGGVARVRLDSTFASTIDANRPYYVFLTPLGETRGLYVTDRTPSGFQVRETEHGRSTIGFDYRIVAHPLDAKNDRLPVAPDSIWRRPHQVPPRPKIANPRN